MVKNALSAIVGALTKADTGRGIVAGLCVAFIAITADRLISAWSNARKRELGIA